MKMRNVITAWMIGIITLLVIACLMTVRIRSTKGTPEYFALNQDQVDELTNRALDKKDVEAAERLALFYRFSKDDRLTARKWDDFIKHCNEMDSSANQ